MGLIDISDKFVTSRGQTFTVAIIGGGFAGTVLAAQLLRQSDAFTTIVLIERGVFPGRGVAYGTQFDGHLLNVPAQKMSAYPDSPDHFLRWAQLNYDSSVKGGDFVPRRVYGQYALSLIQEASRENPGRLKCIQDEADSVETAGHAAKIRLRSGSTLVAEKVVLALGNFPPADLRLAGKTSFSPRFRSNPWSPEPPNFIDGRNVLLIGSGLTAVDVAIELRARGFEGTIHMLSRHGLLPQAHKSAVPLPSLWDKNSPRTARGLLQMVRRQIAAAPARGSNWRAVIDALRPVTQEIWRSLPQVERRRFLRHVRPYWEVHRHRVAPQIGAQLTAQLSTGEIRIHAGHITAYDEDAEGVTVSYRKRGTEQTERLRVERVINCTGPEGDLRRVNSPLLKDLIRRGMLSSDPLGLGFQALPDGTLIDADGVASEFLYTLGSALKGSLWETTAVPEIRVQAEHLATRLRTDRRQANLEFTEMRPLAAALPREM